MLILRHYKWGLARGVSMHEIYEDIVQGIIRDGYVVLDGFLEPPLWMGLGDLLTNRWENGEFKEASIGKGTQSNRMESVRSDHIRWINRNDDHPLEEAFLSRITGLVGYLNQTCFTNLKDFEFHYAIYPPGTFYRRHLDQFLRDDARKFSVICYLNRDWGPTDGGELTLFLEDGEKSISPIGGRLVCFESHRIEHEVKKSYRPRMSITGWLRN